MLLFSIIFKYESVIICSEGTLAIVNNFDYVKPKSLKGALRIFKQYKAPVILAGGTDLLEMLKTGSVVPDVVIDIKGLDVLKRITYKDGVLFIGACVTYTELIESKIIKRRCPVIMEMAKQVASMGVRNRGTMAGNICSAVPCADSSPVLLAYDAQILTKSAQGERSIPAEEWFVGSRKTALNKGEIVRGISIKLEEKPHGAAFVKLGRYDGEDLAQVNLVALALPDKTFKIVFGSVAPVPLRARKIEGILNGNELSKELLEKAKTLVESEIKPISDVRASKEYRLHMAKVMLEMGLEAAIKRLTGKKPVYGTKLL